MGLMRNLAGDKQANIYIQEELVLAGISIVRGPTSKTEVPYSITGTLKWWDFERTWTYWIARAENDGLPLEAAIELHETEYPIEGRGQPQKYGDAIRVRGNAGAPHPTQWALPKHDTALEKELQNLGIDGPVTHGKLIELCNEEKITAHRFVDLYHIDTLPALKKFADVVRKVC